MGGVPEDSMSTGGVLTRACRESVSSRLGIKVFQLLHLPAFSRGLNRSAVNNERRGVGACGLGMAW